MRQISFVLGLGAGIATGLAAFGFFYPQYFGGWFGTGSPREGLTASGPADLTPPPGFDTVTLAPDETGSFMRSDAPGLSRALTEQASLTLDVPPPLAAPGIDAVPVPDYATLAEVPESVADTDPLLGIERLSDPELPPVEMAFGPVTVLEDTGVPSDLSGDPLPRLQTWVASLREPALPEEEGMRGAAPGDAAWSRDTPTRLGRVRTVRPAPVVVPPAGDDNTGVAEPSGPAPDPEPVSDEPDQEVAVRDDSAASADEEPAADAEQEDGTAAEPLDPEILELMLHTAVTQNGFRFEQRVEIEGCDAVVTTTIYGEMSGRATRRISIYDMADSEPIVSTDEAAAELLEAGQPVLRGAKAEDAVAAWKTYAVANCGA